MTDNLYWTRPLGIMLLMGLFIMVSGCKKGPEEQAKKLVQKSIKAHNNSQKWDKLAAISFNKWTRLYNDKDSLEKEIKQLIEVRLKPFYEVKMSWEADGMQHVAKYDGNDMQYIMGSNEIKNPSFLKSKQAELNAAYFAFAQPWALLDESASLMYEGQKTLENGKVVETIKVNFGVESDTWWFYIDPKSYLIQANELQATDHRSMIENLSFNDKTGLILLGDRVSYRLDSLGNKLVKRAEYRYSDYRPFFE